MSCKIVYSPRIRGGRFGSCETHGWVGRWRHWGRERRDAHRHVTTFAALDREPPAFTERTETYKLPIDWRLAAMSAVSAAPVGALVGYLAQR